MKRNKKIKILIIEDEINTIRAAILKLRKRNNTVVDHVVFMEEAEDLLKSQLYNLIIVDARIPSIKQDKLVEEGGLELMHKLTSSESGTININTKYIILLLRLIHYVVNQKYFMKIAKDYSPNYYILYI